MNDEKLKNAADAVWRELNLQLLRAGSVGIGSYVTVILNLLDSAFDMFTKGDNTEKIRLYVKTVKLLNRCVDYLKEKYEF